METAPLNSYSTTTAPSSLDVSVNEGTWGRSQMSLPFPTSPVGLFRAEDLQFSLGMKCKRASIWLGPASGR